MSVEDILMLAAGTAADAERAARIEVLFDRHHVRLFALARRLSPDRETARDLVQETFVRALRHQPPADDRGAEAWLVRALVNLCRDRYRRDRVRDRNVRHLPIPAAAGSPESRAVAAVSVATALAELPPRQRAVVVLALIEDRGTAEIAAILGIARVTVRWHLAAGRAALVRFLGEGDR